MSFLFYFFRGYYDKWIISNILVLVFSGVIHLLKGV